MPAISTHTSNWLSSSPTLLSIMYIFIFARLCRGWSLWPLCRGAWDRHRNSMGSPNPKSLKSTYLRCHQSSCVGGEDASCNFESSQLRRTGRSIRDPRLKLITRVLSIPPFSNSTWISFGISRKSLLLLVILQKFTALRLLLLEYRRWLLWEPPDII